MSQILLYEDRPILVVACGGGVCRRNQSPAVLGTLGKRIVPHVQASRGHSGDEFTFVTALCASPLGLGFGMIRFIRERKLFFRALGETTLLEISIFYRHRA